MMTRFFACVALFAAVPLAGCSIKIGGDDDPPVPISGAGGAAGAAGFGGVSGGSGGCPSGQDRVDGRCVESWRRYEPSVRVDFNNVVVYGEMPTQLSLPDPPKSGFRLIVPPQDMGPGEEKSMCIAWAYPSALRHKHVYSARLYTTGGLHHSNMFGMVHHPMLGPSPYPACNPGQSDLFSHVGEIAQGIIPDVLFANSTQVVGGEQLVFAPGMGFKLTTDGREVATSIHFLNPSNERKRVEIVYDFYTMPPEKVVNDLVPYYYDNFAFEIAANTTADITTTCNLFGAGNIVSLMPHTHERAKQFTVDLLMNDGSEQRIYTGGSFDLESDIEVFAQPIDLTNARQIRHTCTVQNDLGAPIRYGNGTNEMCTLFGYMYPPSAQSLGIVQQNANGACAAANIGSNRK
jgi:hypothetical protein